MAVTAYSAVGDEERIRAAGAQAYVSKPISVVKFAQTVEDLLILKPEDTGESQTNVEPDNGSAPSFSAEKPHTDEGEEGDQGL
jgi:two-component system cell cycle response regulator DivK